MEHIKALAAKLTSDEPEMHDSYEDMDEDMEDVDGETVAAEEVMEALKSGDTEMFKSALRSFVSMCRD